MSKSILPMDLDEALAPRQRVVLKQPHLVNRKQSNFDGISILSPDIDFFVEGYESDMTQVSYWKTTNLPAAEKGYPCYYHPKSHLELRSYICGSIYDERYFCSECH